MVSCHAEKENLCLYGFPDENWEVNLPAEEVPPELPEPALGINFARDGMQKKDWLALVAVHSDAWLLAVAFYYGARFDKNERLVAGECVSCTLLIQQRAESWVMSFAGRGFSTSLMTFQLCSTLSLERRLPRKSLLQTMQEHQARQRLLAKL